MDHEAKQRWLAIQGRLIFGLCAGHKVGLYSSLSNSSNNSNDKHNTNNKNNNTDNNNTTTIAEQKQQQQENNNNKEIPRSRWLAEWNILFYFIHNSFIYVSTIHC